MRGAGLTSRPCGRGLLQRDIQHTTEVVVGEVASRHLPQHRQLLLLGAALSKEGLLGEGSRSAGQLGSVGGGE